MASASFERESAEEVRNTEHRVYRGIVENGGVVEKVKDLGLMRKQRSWEEDVDFQDKVAISANKKKNDFFAAPLRKRECLMKSSCCSKTASFLSQVNIPKSFELSLAYGSVMPNIPTNSMQ